PRRRQSPPRRLGAARRAPRPRRLVAAALPRHGARRRAPVRDLLAHADDAAVAARVPVAAGALALGHPPRPRHLLDGAEFRIRNVRQARPADRARRPRSLVVAAPPPPP